MRTRVLWITSLSILGVACATSSLATVGTGESDSWSLYSRFSTTDFRFGFNVVAIPTATGSAPAPYDITNTQSAFSAASGSFASLTSGQLSASVHSDVDGLSGSRTTSATAFADNVAFTLGGTAIQFSADHVSSSFAVQGDVNAFTSVAGASFSNVSLSIFGTSYSIAANPLPNTVVYDAGGLTIVANQQSTANDGTAISGAAYALNFYFNHFIENGQNIQGGIQFCRSAADMRQPTPEPGSMTALGLLLVCFRRRKRAGKGS